MLFNSLHFLIFFPIVVLLYFAIPRKVRYVWLLIASYYFYMCWNAKYVLLIVFSTIITYISGLLIERVKRCKWNEVRIICWKKIFVAFSFVSNLSMLFFFKYFDFAFDNISAIFLHAGIELNKPEFDILLPVGISFYIFQSLSYTMDVYRDEVNAERNILKYALFLSFFPQLVAGPIERSKNLLKQINNPTDFRVEGVRHGLLTMAYGLVLKMVIADRIAAIIDPILSHYDYYNGMMTLACIVLFAVQIYCDFHGYTQIAIGSAEILGFRLQENFNAPYLASNIKDFWRRWHISLTSWFTDYLYIPLGGNRKGRLRKHVNTLIVFLCSGLWHGADWGYIIWGGLNGCYLILYDLVKPHLDKIYYKLKINTSLIGWKILCRILTFAAVDYMWLYFRAKDLKTAFQMQIKIFNDFHLPYLFSDKLLSMFDSYSSIVILIFSLLFLLFADYLQYCGRDWKAELLKQQIVYRWAVYIGILLIILIYGVYGAEHEQTQFIYFQF